MGRECSAALRELSAYLFTSRAAKSLTCVVVAKGSRIPRDSALKEGCEREVGKHAPVAERLQRKGFVVVFGMASGACAVEGAEEKEQIRPPTHGRWRRRVLHGGIPTDTTCVRSLRDLWFSTLTSIVHRYGATDRLSLCAHLGAWKMSILGKNFIVGIADALDSAEAWRTARRICVAAEVLKSAKLCAGDALALVNAKNSASDASGSKVHPSTPSLHIPVAEINDWREALRGRNCLAIARLVCQ